MLRIAFTLLFCLLLFSTATAQNIDYSRTVAAGAFRTAAFWSPFDPGFPLIGPGGSTDRAHFDLNHTFLTTYAISDVNGVNDQLIIENDSVNLEITNYETVSDGSGVFASVVVGEEAGDSALVVFSGESGSTFDSVNTVIGAVSGSTGSVFVSGDGMQWDNAGNLVVGRAGVGNLIVAFDAFVSSETGVIANFVGSTGTATVNGEDSEWNLGGYSIRVGNSGDGELVVENGGYVRCGNAVVGRLNGSSGNVILDNGELRAIGDIIIGNNTTGSMTIENGGFANSFDHSMIGRLPGSHGEVEVIGEGSLWDVWDNLGIGGLVDGPLSNGGTGLLTIEDGGRVLARGGVILFPGGTLDLEFDGMLTTDSIEFEGGGTFNFNAGELQVGSYEGNLVQNAGVLAPGYEPFDDIGDTTIFGDYTMDAGRLEIEMRGPTIGSDYDTVNVTGDVIVDGGLWLRLIDGFVPDPDQTFIALNTSGSIFGFFFNVGDNERLDTLDGTGSFLVRYGVASPNPNQIVLSDFQPDIILGDVNGDGMVDFLDIEPFVELLENGEYQVEADINQDGVVDFLDIQLFVDLLD